MSNHHINNIPRITVITATLNNAGGLEQTIKSIASQSYPNLEYIVIDGGSTDGSKEVIRKYEDVIDFWVSEKDSGISNAFNKGLERATGEYIAFLNSGDYYINEHSLDNLVHSADRFDIIYGGIVYQRSYKPVVYSKTVLDISYWLRGSIPHQSAMTSRKIFERIGSFNLNLKYCMDYEFFYRAYEAGFKFIALPILITSVNCEGISTTSWKAQLDEFKKIQKEKGASLFMAEFYYYKRFIRMWIYYKLLRLKLFK